MKNFMVVLVLVAVCGPLCAADPDSLLYKYSKGYDTWAASQSRMVRTSMAAADVAYIYPKYVIERVPRSGIFSVQMTLDSTQATIDVTAAAEVLLAPTSKIPYATWAPANESASMYDSRTTTGVWTFRADAEIPGWAIRLRLTNNGNEDVFRDQHIWGMW